MGLWISKLVDLFSLFDNEEARIVMLGLDAAGKTTILYKIKLNENVTSIPTIGFNVETVTPCKGISFTVWDVGGQDKIRRLWGHYYNKSEGLVYVVDSTDRERLNEAREELFGICGDDRMRSVPVVVIANKQDLPNAMKVSDIAAGLHLDELGTRKWHIHAGCAVTGEGICESMEEMAKLVKEFKKTGR